MYVLSSVCEFLQSNSIFCQGFKKISFVKDILESCIKTIPILQKEFCPFFGLSRLTLCVCPTLKTHFEHRKWQVSVLFCFAWLYRTVAELWLLLPQYVSQCTEVRFASFLSGWFITAIVCSKSIGKETGKMHLCAVVERVAIINIKDAKGGILILVDNGPLGCYL